MGAVGTGQPAQGCDKTAGQKREGAMVLLWGAASWWPHTEALGVGCALGRIMSFSWGTAVQGCFSRTHTRLWGSAASVIILGFKWGLNHRRGGSGDVRNLLTHFPFLFPLEAKIPFLLLPFEVRILDTTPILLVLPFLGLFPSMRGVEGPGMT